MKKILGFLVLMVVGIFLANAFAYEGGTKFVATMTHPGEKPASFGPILVVPSSEMTPSKPILKLLNRIPEPTLSVERMRVEKLGPSLGTKALVRFQEGWKS